MNSVVIQFHFLNVTCIIRYYSKSFLHERLLNKHTSFSISFENVTCMWYKSIIVNVFWMKECRMNLGVIQDNLYNVTCNIIVIVKVS